MKHLRTRELEPTIKHEDRRSKTRDATWDRIVATITNPNLIAVMIIGIIGCLIAVNLILRFPDLGLTVEQFNPFAGP
jgi:hypothetical protein